MTEKQPIISVRNLSMGFPGRVLLQNVDFDIFPGEIFIILGGSGCGKSTLLKHLVGLLPPLNGTINIDEQQLNPKDEKSYKQILQKIGIAYQGGALFGSMTLAENVSLPIEEFTDLPSSMIENLARIKLALVGLQGFEHYLPMEISGGMKKRAGIARALALNPKILFLDEPSAGLDPISSAELDQLILNLKASLGMTMIIVSHELPSIYSIADRVIMLDKKTKSIIAQGNPAYLRDNSDNPFVHSFFNRTELETT